MNYNQLSVLVLFGGANREQVVFRLLKEGIKVKKIIVPSYMSNKLKKSVIEFEKLSIAIEFISKKNLSSILENSNQSLLLSIGFPYILPKSIFSKFFLSINLHPSLLPKYRGSITLPYMLKNNEKFSGSTVHIIEEEVDKGDIIAQSKVNISPFDTLRSLQKKIYQSEPDLVIKAINNIISGFEPTKQDQDTSFDYFVPRTPDDSIIDVNKPLIELINDIRACDPDEYPAYFLYHGEKVCLKLWRPEKNNNEEEEL